MLCFLKLYFVTADMMLKIIIQDIWAMYLEIDAYLCLSHGSNWWYISAEAEEKNNDTFCGLSLDEWLYTYSYGEYGWNRYYIRYYKNKIIYILWYDFCWVVLTSSNQTGEGEGLAHRVGSDHAAHLQPRAVDDSHPPGRHCGAEIHHISHWEVTQHGKENVNSYSNDPTKYMNSQNHVIEKDFNS